MLRGCHDHTCLSERSLELQDDSGLDELNVNQNTVEITQAKADKGVIWAVVQGRIKKEDKHEF